ncbi:MAG: HYR domain-containing protein [Bacteroidota bacterium]
MKKRDNTFHYPFAGLLLAILSLAIHPNFAQNTRYLNVASPIVSLSVQNPTCAGDSNGSIFASVTGGTAPYSYQWSTGATSSSIINLGVGSYALTVTDATSLTATSSTDLSAESDFSLSINGSSLLCANACDGTLAALVGGPPGNSYTYLWSTVPPQVTAIATGLCAGTYSVTVTNQANCLRTASFTIGEQEEINTSFSLLSPACQGSCDGRITVNVDGGDPPYSYEWSANTGSQLTSTVTGVCADFYSVTITDFSGCTQVDTVSLSEPDLLQVVFEVFDECQNSGPGGRINALPIGGTPPFLYTWLLEGGGFFSSSNPIEDLEAGTYGFTVEDANGCFIFDSVELALSDLAVDLVGNPPLCHNDSTGSILAQVSGGQAPLQYTWSTGAVDTNRIEDLPSGPYSVTVTDAGGCSTGNFTNFPFVPELDIDPILFQPDCAGQCTGQILILVPQANGQVAYEWSNNLPPTQTQENLCAGSYSVTITDGNGCTATTDLTITDPPSLLLDATVQTASCRLCNGAIDLTPTGGTPPYVFDWSHRPINTEDLSDLCPGNYSVTVTDNNNCAVTADLIISERIPTTTTFTINNATDSTSNDGSICAQVSEGLPPYAYQWSTGDTTACIDSLSIGAYALTVTDSEGCGTEDTVLVNILPCPLTVTVTALDVFCPGDSSGRAIATIGNGVPPYDLRWSSGGNSNPETQLPAGNYQLTVIDSDSCSRVVNFSIGEPAAITASVVVVQDISCAGAADGIASVTAGGGTGPYLFTWSNGGSGSTQNNLAADGTVRVTDSNGCTATFPYQIPEPPALDLQVSSTPESTLGMMDGTATATATGGTPPYAYDWSNGGDTATIQNLAPGTYSVTLSDANGCTQSQSVEVNAGGCSLVLESLTLAAVTCGIDSSGSASVLVSGGTPPYTYLWSSGGSSSVETQLPVGNYSVSVVDDDACVVSSNFSIDSELDTEEPTIDPVPLDRVLYLDAQGLARLSLGDLNASATDNCGPVTVSIDREQFGCNNLGAQTVNYSAIDPSGNLSIASFTVTVRDTIPPVARARDSLFVYLDASGQAPIRLPDIDLGSSDNCTGDSIIIDRFQRFCENVGQPLVVTLTIFDRQGNSARDSTVVITLDTFPPRMICANDFEVQSHCDTLVFYDAAAEDNCAVDTLRLLEGLPSGSVFGPGATRVTYEATDVSGNRDTCTFVVTVVAPVFAAEVNVVREACPGQSDGSVAVQILEGDLSYTFQWDDPQRQTGDTATDLTAGMYTVAVMAQGCVIEELTIELPESPAVAIVVDGVSPASSGQSDGAIEVTVTGGVAPLRYEWRQDTMVVGTEEDLSGVMAGDYVLRVVDDNGCIFRSDTITVDELVGLGGPGEAEDIQLAPVPTRDWLVLSFRGVAAQQAWSWRLLDVQGRVVHGSDQWRSGARWEIDLSGLADGLYYLQLETAERRVVRKVVVLH